MVFIDTTLRNSLAWRTSAAILFFSALVGAMCVTACMLYLQRAEQQRMDQHLWQLIETVKGTANIAAFTGDSTLAAEVATGMLNNRLVARVIIRTDQTILADRGDRTAPTLTLTRPLMSPFDSNEIVGSIALAPNVAEIHAQSMQWSRVSAVMLSLVVAVIAVVVVAVVQSTITAPIKRVAQLLRSMDPLSGATLASPPADANNEIGQLVNAFNGLIRRVAKQAQQLRQHGDQLQEMVAERTRDLLEAKNAAENANRTKSEFLSKMSHELRTPMHAILSFARLGVDRSEQGPPQKLKHYFNSVLTSGDRLLVLLNNLLDLSKLEAGMMDLSLETEDIAKLAQDAVKTFSLLAAEKRITITFENQTADSKLHCDAAKIHQVLSNLLSNALKFSPSGSNISVCLRAGEWIGSTELAGSMAGLEISVNDQGVGIPEGELERVFDKFVQSSKTRSGAGGTGLGLSIVREIVKLHGGSIHAANNPTGGASFVVKLPYATVHKITSSTETASAVL